MPVTRPREIPSGEVILALSKFDVLDENGRAVTFGSLFERKKTVAIFIRKHHYTVVFSPFLRTLFIGHFWCAVSAFLHALPFDLFH